MSSQIFALSAHASYACRHSGACCTAGWTIPVEPPARSVLRVDWLTPDADGACPQYDRGAARCRVHRDHGEAMLPRSCHHFPRRALVDDRGTFVTLSHFCPTAASLLLDLEHPLTIVESPRAFPEARDYDGLDARGEWPPLVRPGILFDAQSYSAWERHLVTAIASDDDDVMVALRGVARDAERLRAWRVSDGPLLDWTMTVIERHARDVTTRLDLVANATFARYAPFTGLTAYRQVCRFVPAGLHTPAAQETIEAADAALVEPGWRSVAPLVGRYVAARAFGSWTAYQSHGVRAQIAELHVAASVLRVECALAAGRLQRALDRDVLIEAVRASDLLLVHLADREALVEWLREAEGDEPVRTRR